MKIECTEKQAEIIRRALELYGRIRMFQFDFVMDDFNFNKLTGNENSNIPYEDTKYFNAVGKSIVEKYLPRFERRDQDGDIAFSMHRQIHKARSNHGNDCCTCNRADMLAGQPALKIEV